MTEIESNIETELSLKELQENLIFLESLNLTNENLPELSNQNFRNKLANILDVKIKYHTNIDNTIDNTGFKINEIIIRCGEINYLKNKIPMLKKITLADLNKIILDSKNKIISKIENINKKNKLKSQYKIEPLDSEKDQQIKKIGSFESFIRERIYVHSFGFLKNILSKKELILIYSSDENDFQKLYDELEISKKMINKKPA